MGNPTPEQFSGWLDFHLDKAVKRAKVSANDIAHEHGGGGYGSSRMVIAILESMRAEIEVGIDVAFGQLKRGLSEHWFDRGTLRVETERALRRFDAAMTKAIPFDMSRVDPKMADPTFASQIDFAVSMWDAGLLDPKAPAEPLTMTNNINVRTMVGGAIQQGTHDSVQNVSVDIDLNAARTALADVESLLASLPREVADQLRPELDTLRIQLAKPAPSTGLLREIGNSIRTVLEGTVAGALAPEAISTVHKLLIAIGMTS